MWLDSDTRRPVGDFLGLGLPDNLADREVVPVRVPAVQECGRDRLKPYIRSAEADDLLHGLESVGVVVAELPEMDLSPAPKDNPILATGLAGQADLVVSGDKRDMLALRHVEGIPIVTPRDATARLHREARGKEEGCPPGSRGDWS